MTFSHSPDLKRFPARRNDPLQAWDSADELILAHLSEAPPADGARLLILNDSNGALTCALANAPYVTTCYTDSFVAKRAIESNLAAPSRETEIRSSPRLIHDLHDFTETYDYVLIRVPKNMSFFEDQLCHLSAHLNANTQVICGYMLKHQADASFALLAKYIGETSTSLAKKKARLIFARVQKSSVTSPYPMQVALDTFALPFTHHSNLFSRERLDVGTRFLLQNLPAGRCESVLDLGCANGVVGIAAQRLYPAAKVSFTDESWMAVQSARANYVRYFPEQNADFLWGHCADGVATGSVNLVLCNPPFHQGNVVGEEIAGEMFRAAHRVLAKGGVLRVIGNSHLRYPQALGTVFGKSHFVARNTKFTIIDAIR